MEVVSSLPQTSALPPRQGRFHSEVKVGGESQPIRSRKWVNEVASGATRRRRRNPSDETKELRAERVASLGEAETSGSLATLAELTNPDKRPARPPGGIRGIVVSDVFRQLVARTLAQQHAKVSAFAPSR